MNALLLAGLLIGLTSAQNSERSCPCEYGGIWLDIIALIDNSASMTAAGLAQVQANLATVGGQLSISQTKGHTSRISLISYHSSATIVADLSYYNQTDTFANDVFERIPSTSVQALNIEAALQAAGSVLATRGSDRENYKTVILLYASAYSTGGFTDPLPAANNLKESGTPIITIAFSQADTSNQVQRIAALASPNFSFNSTDTSVISEIFAALCQVNCYCPNNFVQYADRYTNPTRKYGECLRYVDIDAAWTPAKFACRNLIPGGSSFLVQEFTQEKHDFNQRKFLFPFPVYKTKNAEVVSQSITNNGSNVWHLGLSWNNTHYIWEGENESQIPLGSFYTAWAPSFPNTVFGSAVTNYNGQWENENPNTKATRYVCQALTCDTQKYCETLG